MASTIVESFAIVGLSFKMPQEAVNEKSFWEVLESRKNLMTEWPESRVNVDSFYDNGSQKPNTLHGRGAHFIKGDPGVFDAPFFTISSKEASAMDPQQRWALEATYHALENAGIPLETIHRSATGVFASSFSDEYARMLSKDPDTAPRYTGIGTACSVVPNRVSWFFNLCGPSVHIDTACSSGLVALDMACQSMQCGESTSAIVIGSSLLLSPELTTLLANMSFLSSHSRCYSFDARGNGFARGEGVVALVIKPLQAALDNQDNIRAVIRATASNQDGRTPGLTKPSAEAQENLIRRTYAKAGLDFASTRYFEAHGTGTAVGDPIEMKAIGRVFRSSRSAEEPLFVGSVKANIGHLEAASGLAGIVKCIMILEKGIIPPNALIEKLNPEIDGDGFNIQVPTHSIPWPARGPRRISVNSFGFGGTNSHVILDDAFHYLQHRGISGCRRAVDNSGAPPARNGVSIPEPNGTHSSRSSPKLLVWTAADAGAIQRTQDVYQRYYQDHVMGNDEKIGQLAYTLAARRTNMPWRTFAVVHNNGMSNGHDARSAVSHSLLDMTKPVRESTENISVGFVFTGQGAQYVRMGSDLQKYPVFARSLQNSDKILAGLGCAWSLFDIMHHGDKIHYPEFSQPLCTILQLALVDLLRSFNLTPGVVTGHSSGEIAAAYAAGALSQESACKVAYYRGQVAEKVRLASRTRPGAMISVNLTETEVPAHLEHLAIGSSTIYVACVNSSTNLTLAGPSDAIDAVKTRLDQRNIFAHKVNTGVAYHTPAMLAVAEEYAELLGVLEMPCETTQLVPMISSVTGHMVSVEELITAQYWVNNLTSPVRFSDAMRCIGHIGSLSKLLPLGVGTTADLVEIGPHSALRRPIEQTAPSLRYHCVLERGKAPQVTLLKVIGALFCHGQTVSVLDANMQRAKTVACLTDCPPYPFDHSRRYWAESRLSKDYRLRPHISAHLLGRRANDWNPLQPRWRNWMCTEILPWLGDHIVNDVAVLPGAGMLVMALEAARESVASRGLPISGFLLRNAQFLAPIVVRKDLQDSVETTIELRPIMNVQEKESLRSEARLYSFSDGAWTLNFRSEIELQREDTKDPDLAWTNESGHEQNRIRQHVTSKSRICTSLIDERSFYRFCGKQGLRYGPSFQLLRDLAWDDHQTSTGRIDMAPISKLCGYADSPVHPAVLDAALQLLMVQASKGASQSIPTFVPKQMDSIWISSRRWENSSDSVKISSTLSADQENELGLTGSVELVDDDNLPLCTIKSVSLAELSRSNHHNDDKGRDTRSLLHGVDWKPQLSSLNAEALAKLCKAHLPLTPEPVRPDFYPKIELAMRISAGKALKQITQDDISRAPAYIKRYVASLEHRYGAQSSNPEAMMSDLTLEELLQECEKEQPHWRMFPAVARALPSIIRGETSALNLLFSSKAAEEFYLYVFGGIARDDRLGRFLDLATHEKPDLRILEVGAGTGSMTRSILATLQTMEQRTGQTRFSEYTYTDISPSFFEEGRKKFQDWEDRLTFKTLDLEQDPTQQGYQAGSYDMIFAGSVLHVTSDLVATLKKCHRLLRPGGHLVFIEITSLNSACANIGFGSLEGWWSGSEKWRQYGPLATESHWDKLLRQSGFSGTELVLRDSENESCHLVSTLISKALSTSVDHGTNGFEVCKKPNILLLIDSESKVQCGLAEAMRQEFPNARDVSLHSKPGMDTEIVVSLLECGISRLDKLDASDFERTKDHILAAKSLVWVACGREDGKPNTHASLANGLFRVLRNELDNKRIVTLSIESGARGNEAEHIAQTLRSCFLDTPQSPEVELVVRDGVLTIGRLVEEKQLHADHLRRAHAQTVTEAWGQGPKLTTEFRTSGMLDTLHFAQDTQDADLAPDEVEIQAVVWPISFRDVFIALGRLGREKLGFECAGTITRVGAACDNELKPGDRVLMVVPGCMKSHPRAPAHSVFKLPDSVTYHDAVAGMNPTMTAWYALTHIAGLRRGDKILIHSAAGSSGQMAVKIAKMHGAEVFVTVGSEDKRQLVMSPDGLNIPESHVFYSRDTSFAAGVMRLTGGYGVDVVLNSLSGSGLRASWQCMAPYGRFVDIGKSDIKANSSLPMAGFARNVSFASVDLHHIVQTNIPLTRELVNKSLQLAADEMVGVPAPLHLFKISELVKAMRYMQSGKNTGRILVTIDPHDEVPKSILHECRWHFDPNASYLVAGGLGGLGRPVLRWMSDRGARNIIIPSRSGASSQLARNIISELSSKGINAIAPQCDISSAAEVEAMLKACDQLPPIRGCLNLSMVLQDAVFETMAHAQWMAAVRPKVNGSWNLHQQLQGLDFFILVASLSGIAGSVTQSNYAAGNTFQDALARMRAGIDGLGTSVSLDLGWVRDAGWVQENSDDSSERKISHYFHPVEVRDFLAVLEHFCDPSLPPPSPEKSQLLIGAKVPDDFRTTGEVIPWGYKRPLFLPFNVVRPHTAMVKKANGTADPTQEDAPQMFRQAKDGKQRVSVVIDALRAKLSGALSIDIEDVDPHKRLLDYGVDSLMAIELRNWFWWSFRASVAVFEIMDPAIDLKGVGQLVADKAE